MDDIDIIESSLDMPDKLMVTQTESIDEIVVVGVRRSGGGIDPLEAFALLNALINNMLALAAQQAPGDDSEATPMAIGTVNLTLLEDDGTVIDEVELVISQGAQVSDNDDGAEIENWENQIVDVLYQTTNVAYGVEYDEDSGIYFAAPLIG